MAPYKNQNPRVVLRGWRPHPVAARIMLLLMLVGLSVSHWLPDDFGMLKTTLQLIGAFSTGVLVSKEMAIWQKI